MKVLSPRSPRDLGEVFGYKIRPLHGLKEPLFWHLHETDTSYIPIFLYWSHRYLIVCLYVSIVHNMRDRYRARREVKNGVVRIYNDSAARLFAGQVYRDRKASLLCSCKTRPPSIPVPNVYLPTMLDAVEW